MKMIIKMHFVQVIISATPGCLLELFLRKLQIWQIIRCSLNLGKFRVINLTGVKVNFAQWRYSNQ